MGEQLSDALLNILKVFDKNIINIIFSFFMVVMFSFLMKIVFKSILDKKKNVSIELIGKDGGKIKIEGKDEVSQNELSKNNDVKIDNNEKKNKFIKKIKKMLLNFLNNDEQNLVAINDHRVFHKLDEIIQSGEDIIAHCDCFNNKTYDELKSCSEEENEIYYDSIKCQLINIFMKKCVFVVYKEELMNIVSELIGNNGHSISNINKRIWNISNIYEERSRKIKIIINNFEIDGIPESILYKFKRWNSIHNNRITDKIEIILLDKFYNSWKMRLIVIFEILDTYLDVMVEDAANTFKSLNGEVINEIAFKLSKKYESESIKTILKN